MNENFTNILTKIGQQKKALAEANNTPLNITTFKVGDGNGVYYEPNENQTALVNVKYTGTFLAGTQSQIIVNPSAANEVLYKCFIPADIGGFTIRELGLFDDEEDLILICKLPAQDKFALASGVYQPLTFTPKIIYSNPLIQAVLTPTSQTIPTTGEVTTLIETAIAEYVPETIYTDPIKNIDGTISLEIDSSLKVENNKLGVASVISCSAPLSKTGNNISIDIDSSLKVQNNKLGAIDQLNKFCVNRGNIDATGNSDLLAYSSTILSFKVGGSYPDLILTYADRTQETLTSLNNITGFLTNGTYTIIKEKGLNPVATLSSVTQNKTFPTSPVDGDHHCLTATGLKSYKRISNEWVETQYIILGTVTVAGNIITAVTTPSYNQNGYDFNVGWVAISGILTGTSNTSLTFQDNLNTLNKEIIIRRRYNSSYKWTYQHKINIYNGQNYQLGYSPVVKTENISVAQMCNFLNYTGMGEVDGLESFPSGVQNTCEVQFIVRRLF